MTKEAMTNAFHDIGLALCATHGTVACDFPEVKPEDDYSWRVDHSQEMNLLQQLEKELKTNSDTGL